MKLRNLLIIPLLFLLGSTGAYAGDGDWNVIAEKTVSFKSETDTVNPISPFASTNFSHIKIKCTQGTVNLKSIKVTMSNGKEKEFDSLGVLTSGMSSRSLNLPNKDGVKLDKIELKYESVGNTALKVAGVTEKAKVEILGKQEK